MDYKISYLPEREQPLLTVFTKLYTAQIAQAIVAYFKTCGQVIIRINDNNLDYVSFKLIHMATQEEEMMICTRFPLLFGSLFNTIVNFQSIPKQFTLKPLEPKDVNAELIKDIDSLIQKIRTTVITKEQAELIVPNM